MIIQRQNRMGLKFTISEDAKGKTKITHRQKYIIVNAELEQINKSWFRWHMMGEYVQKAFSYLSASEREFLLTGLTDDEFNNIFPKEE